MTTNADRADWAQEAINRFKLRTRQDDDKEAVGDLIANLMHLAKALGLNPYLVVADAAAMYAEEAEGHAWGDPI